ncbi:glycosyltransferase [Marivirga tractuosa]|uniref:glycosyltransferase family 2 protein n=1 Tax=Marivirga tractuosa TaxID=1006 RepID=UPI0035CF3570
MEASSPILSIVMPAFNAGTYIKDSIESVLNQTFDNFELIIINDGSTDETESIIRLFEDKRIRYYSNEKNRGLFFTRNKGLSLSVGKYIAMLDSDDIAIQDRFEYQINFLENNPDTVLVGSSSIIIDENGFETGELYIQNAPSEAYSSIMLFNNYIIQSSIMCDRRIMQEFGYRKEFPPAEDYDLWVRLAKEYKIFSLKKPLVKYRIHSSSISHTSRDVQINGIKNNYKEQLKWLGIEATEREIELHYEIANSTFPISRKTFIEGRIWLRKLHEQNIKKKIFLEEIFNYILIRMWIKIFIKSFQAKPFISIKEFFHLPFLKPFQIIKY